MFEKDGFPYGAWLRADGGNGTAIQNRKHNMVFSDPSPTLEHREGGNSLLSKTVALVSNPSILHNTAPIMEKKETTVTVDDSLVQR